MVNCFSLNRYIDQIEAMCEAAALQRHVRFSNLCTMRVGGEIEAVYAPTDQDALCRRLLVARHMQIPYFLCGGGSNIVPGDGCFLGVVFLTTGLRKISISGTKIKADCGVRLNDLVLAAANAGLGGLESLYGIPGTVGGAVKMNAGAHGCDTAMCLESVTMFSAVSGERRVFLKQELQLSYRMSLLQKTSEWILLDATFSCIPTETKVLRSRIAEVIKKRRETQPLSFPSAGSVFRRPKEGDVWRMVDQCGLRGYTVGGAQISEQHAGFIINRGGATAADIFQLVCLIKDRVLDSLGVKLTPEIEFFHLNEEETCHLQKR